MSMMLLFVILGQSNWKIPRTDFSRALAMTTDGSTNTNVTLSIICTGRYAVLHLSR